MSDHRHAQLHTQQHIHRCTYRTYTHSAALCSPCQHQLWQHFYLLNVWKCNYFSVWMCVHVCVRLHAHVSYLQWGEWAKATESIGSNVRNLVLTQVTGEKEWESVCVWDYSNTQQWGSFLCECPRTVWKNDYAKVHQQRSWHGDKSKKEGTEYVSKWGQARKWKQWHVKCSSCQSVLTVVRYIIKHCCWGEVNTVSRRVNNLVTLHVFSIFGHLHDNNFSSINLYICMTVYIVY